MGPACHAQTSIPQPPALTRLGCFSSLTRLGCFSSLTRLGCFSSLTRLGYFPVKPPRDILSSLRAGVTSLASLRAEGDSFGSLALLRKKGLRGVQACRERGAVKPFAAAKHLQPVSPPVILGLFCTSGVILYLSWFCSIVPVVVRGCFTSPKPHLAFRSPAQIKSSGTI